MGFGSQARIAKNGLCPPCRMGTSRGCPGEGAKIGNEMRLVAIAHMGGDACPSESCPAIGKGRSGGDPDFW